MVVLHKKRTYDFGEAAGEKNALMNEWLFKLKHEENSTHCKVGQKNLT